MNRYSNFKSASRLQSLDKMDHDLFEQFDLRRPELDPPPPTPSSTLELLSKAKLIASANRERIDNYRRRVTMQPSADTFMTGLVVDIERPPSVQEPEPEPEERTYEEMMNQIDSMKGGDDALQRLIKRVNETDKVIRGVGHRLSNMKGSVSKLALSYEKGRLAHEVDSLPVVIRSKQELPAFLRR